MEGGLEGEAGKADANEIFLVFYYVRLPSWPSLQRVNKCHRKQLSTMLMRVPHYLCFLTSPCLRIPFHWWYPGRLGKVREMLRTSGKNGVCNEEEKMSSGWPLLRRREATDESSGLTDGAPIRLALRPLSHQSSLCLQLSTSLIPLISFTQHLSDIH